MIDIVGYLAGCLAMSSFVPQVIKTLRTRSARDLSLPMLGMTLATNLLYIVYGAALHLTPLVIMVGIMSLVVLLQIVLTHQVHQA